MPLDEFIAEALAGLERGDAEIAVGMAARLFEGRDDLVEQLNGR